MTFFRTLLSKLGTRRYRGEVLGHVLEVRFGIYGDHTVLLDGKPVIEQPHAWFKGLDTYHFPMTQPDGATRNIEVKIKDPSVIGLWISVEVRVDGVQLARLAEVPPDDKPERCVYCGYSLKDLEVVNHEIKCPECGRHTPEKVARTA